MIEDIHLKNEGSYDTNGAQLNGLKDVNFIFGANGAGKTTISRVIQGNTARPDCTITWRNGAELDTRVYNRDFVRDHFDESSNIRGIYTFGKNVEVTKEIEKLTSKRALIDKELTGLRQNLDGGGGKTGKKPERNALDEQFKKDIWTEKKRFDDLKDAFSGHNSSGAKFRDRYLEVAKTNNSALKSLDELQEAAKTVFASGLTEEPLIVKPDYGAFLVSESDAILARKIIGKGDVDIAALIIKLGNSDWMRQGRTYLEKSDDVCPFCQQDVPPDLRDELERYFDETYLKDIQALETLLSDYNAAARQQLELYDEIIAAASRFLDRAAFEQDLKTLRVTLESNIATINRKKDNPSLPVTLEASKGSFEALSGHIEVANKKAEENNDTLKHQAARQRTLASEIWKRFLEDTKTIYAKYSQGREKLDKAIIGLEQGVEKKTKALETADQEIQVKEREITSIKPAIDDINNLLASFGFKNFRLTESAKEGFYEVRRPDGTDAKDTLSEGEKSFITFLYFYFWIKGSFETSGGTTDRIVVFDDPVSSLDSDVLFIVCNLILNVMNEMRAGESPVRQIFILTHNIYFHREIVFQKEKKTKAAGKLNHGFWVIRKLSNRSEIKAHTENPVKSSYDLLWQEVRRENPSSAVIQNVLRRILEHYFTFYGGIDSDEITNKFEGNDRKVCSALFAWINDGSHYTNDDLYMSCSDEQVQRYLNVFQRIFEDNGHGGHYRLMMRDAYTPLPAHESDGQGGETDLFAAVAAAVNDREATLASNEPIER